MIFDFFRSHDGRWIATGGSACVVRVWEFIPGNLEPAQPPTNDTRGRQPYGHNQRDPLILINESRGHSRAITSIAFSNDSKQLVSVGEDGGIFVWCFFAPG